MIFHDLWHCYSHKSLGFFHEPQMDHPHGAQDPDDLNRCRTVHFLSFGKSNIAGYIIYHISYIIYTYE